MMMMRRLLKKTPLTRWKTSRHQMKMKKKRKQMSTTSTSQEALSMMVAMCSLRKRVMKKTRVDLTI